MQFIEAHAYITYRLCTKSQLTPFWRLSWEHGITQWILNLFVWFSFELICANCLSPIQSVAKKTTGINPPETWIALRWHDLIVQPCVSVEGLNEATSFAYRQQIKRTCAHYLFINDWLIMLAKCSSCSKHFIFIRYAIEMFRHERMDTRLLSTAYNINFIVAYVIAFMIGNLFYHYKLIFAYHRNEYRRYKYFIFWFLAKQQRHNNRLITGNLCIGTAICALATAKCIVAVCEL